MPAYPQIVLKRSKTDSARRFHPWIFSGAIKRMDNGISEGDLVEVFSEDGEYLAIGHYAPGSIAVRIVGFERIANVRTLWDERFRNAYGLRKTAGLAENAATNAYRLINAEGDGMPGLIVDWYNGTAVMQTHSEGMHREAHTFAEILRAIYGERLRAVYHKPHSSKGSGKAGGQYLFGEKTGGLITENGLRFNVDWERGQKTGFFLDQRDNRSILSGYAQGKRVLNTFCYSGGFSVYAACAGASLVHSVDSSARAIEWTDENIALNETGSEHQSFVADVFDFLHGAPNDFYDVIVLDPPAFAKNISARHQAVQAYRRLNLAAFKKVAAGGIIFTFSCSQAVGPGMFSGAVTAAAIESGRNVRILRHLFQPADHPVNIYHPEGLYLKGLALAVW
ncbi:MAG: class I SAM-dependent rRNA methyltransferase [Nitrospirae bacterium]|nr:class I SAM-dependent rRNA methyltransferase [Nitrospirota bacterium]